MTIAKTTLYSNTMGYAEREGRRPGVLENSSKKPEHSPRPIRLSVYQNPMSVDTQPEARPLLSVLIPAYNYADGVRRIVLPLLSERRSDIEILVCDDSSDNQVETAIRELSAPDISLRYIRNFPALGAVNNWNSLLQQARGQYLILMHHDDFPLSETFASELIAELERHAWPDALILSCLAYDITRKKIAPCLCNPLRAFVTRHWPSYLFRRNVIGPPSVLVVQQDLFEGYDPDLKWLVDVEAYFRFLTAQSRRLVFSPLMLVSSTGMSHSISTTIKSSIKEITDTELVLIEAKFQRMNCRPFLRRSFFLGKLFIASDKLFWLMAITASRLRNIVKMTSLTNAVAHREHCIDSIVSPKQERAADVV